MPSHPRGAEWQVGMKDHTAPGCIRGSTISARDIWGFSYAHSTEVSTLRISIIIDGPRMQLRLVLPTELKLGVLTGTFILKSSLLNLKARSERVLWKNPVGRRTRTSWRFAGKDACGEQKGVDRWWTAVADAGVPHTCS